MNFGQPNMSSFIPSVRTMLLSAALLGAPAFAQSADVSVRVGAFDGGSSPSLSAGGRARSYGVTVTNLGPDPATDIRVTATPPGGGGEVEVPDDSDCAAPAADAGASYTCSLPTLAAGESARFTWTVSWAPPDEPPATCPTQTGLSATVTATESDPASANNSSTLPDLVPPLAYLSATAESPAPPSTDGGNPEKRVNAGESITLKGSITNLGPCAVPADSITIDSSLDNTGSFGLQFEKGAGGCTDWSVSMPRDTADGICTVPTALAANEKVEFTVTQIVKELGGGKDAGGDSIVQSAAVWDYVVDYPGNPLPTEPSTTIIIAGPTNACSVTGGGLGLGLALLLLARRRRS